MNIKNSYLLYLLYISFTGTIHTSDKYKVNTNVIQIKDVYNVPTLQHLCKQTVRADWNKKIDTAFQLVSKQEWSDTDTEQFTAILEHNEHLQHPCIANNANLISLFDIKNNDKKKYLTV